ncbi:unnamed protein product [Lathyrus sativus]|nr:unnamed protein product [Lathyrus sativus]
MKNTRDFTMVLISFFMIMFYSRGELLSSLESHSFFTFLKALDSNNVLNITNTSNPCFNNKFNGVTCNSNATNIIEINLDNMNLSGIFDVDSLCKLQNLRVVSLANNNIKGNISNSILLCRSLVYLNVTNNKLSGRLPKALKRLKYLKNLDLSNNNFSSNYMVKISKLESGSDGVYRLEPTPSYLNLNNSNTSEKGKKAWYSHHILVWLVLGVGLLLSSLYFMVKKSSKLMGESKVKVKKKHTVSPMKKTTSEVRLKGGVNSNSELVFFVEDHERFSLEDLLRAKADLRSENFWSSLFKVKLENNVEYGVKRMKNLQVSCDEFGEILKKISEVKHENILPLVGYRCTSEEKLIIYKYQSNGSLLNLLNDYIAKRKKFPWKLRLEIARGIARGLAFIYKKLDEREINIPHGNIKLSNILLNEKNEALISEHGLSKFFDPNRGPNLFSSHGHTAPEKTLTEKGDVYSFGVILLELLTGQSTEASRIDLVRWVRSMVREEWTGEVFDNEVRENDQQGAFSMLNIALKCVSGLQENRPNIEEVLEIIEEVMNAHEKHEMEVSASKCCSNGSNQECCSLHQIIPDTWDSPGSNY